MCPPVSWGSLLNIFLKSAAIIARISCMNFHFPSIDAGVFLIFIIKYQQLSAKKPQSSQMRPSTELSYVFPNQKTYKRAICKGLALFTLRYQAMARNNSCYYSLLPKYCSQPSFNFKCLLKFIYIYIWLKTFHISGLSVVKVTGRKAPIKTRKKQLRWIVTLQYSSFTIKTVSNLLCNMW